MRLARIMHGVGLAILGIGAASAPGLAQSRSAVVRVSARVVDVGAVSAMTAVPESPSAATASAGVPTDGAGQVFTVVPPRHSPVAVSMHVDHAHAAAPGSLAIQLCRPSERPGARCRRVPLADSLDGRGAAAVTDETVLVRLLGLADAADAATRVTVTLAYPGT